MATTSYRIAAYPMLVAQETIALGQKKQTGAGQVSRSRLASSPARLA
jgi:hypothetical protein